MTLPANRIEGVSQTIHENEPEKLRNQVHHEKYWPRNLQIAEKPTEWPLWYRWTLVAPVATMNMLDSFATMTIVPAVPQVFTQFNVTSALDFTLVVSIWELGEGLGPFLVAPLSELFGRAAIYHVGNCLFVLCLVASALSTNMSMLIAFRFLNGLTTTSLTLAPSIVGDLFIQEERGSAMAVATLFPLVGPFAAPIVGSYIAEAKGWRWTIWVIAIAVGILMCISLLLIRETYYPIILQRRNKLRGEAEPSVPQGVQARFRRRNFRALTRPFRMLFFSPIIFALSFYTALTYGMSYLIMTTLTEIFEDSYGFSQGAVGLLFLGQAVGMILGIFLYGATSDTYLKFRASKQGTLQPENRLLFMVLGSVILPIGLFTYGWTLHYHVVWIAPIVGTALVGGSVILTILPTENYLVDAYEDFGASAIAIGVVMRAIIGALLPLAGPSLYANLGYGWGNSLLGFLATAFIPIVISLFSWGHRIRGDPQRWSG